MDPHEIAQRAIREAQEAIQRVAEQSLQQLAATLAGAKRTGKVQADAPVVKEDLGTTGGHSGKTPQDNTGTPASPGGAAAGSQDPPSATDGLALVVRPATDQDFRTNPWPRAGWERYRPTPSGYATKLVVGGDLPPEQYWREIPRHGPGNNNTVGLEWLYQREEFVNWAIGLQSRIPEDTDMTVEETSRIARRYMGVFVPLSKMTWVRRKEGWLPLMDGVSALVQAAKVMRRLHWGEVLRAIVWEPRQNNPDYWEFQILEVDMPDGSKRWFFRNNSSLRWYKKRYDLTQEMIDDDRMGKQERWGRYDPWHRNFGTGVGDAEDEENYRRAHRDDWGYRM